MNIEKAKEFYRSRTNASLLWLRNQHIFDQEMEKHYPEYSKRNNRITENSKILFELLNEEIKSRNIEVRSE